MPLLGERGPLGVPAAGGAGMAAAAGLGRGRRLAAGLVSVCSNPSCASGWLRWWRGRQGPVFEGGWLCGPECAKTRIRAAIARELKGRNPPAIAHRHRVPLGLLLLSHGAVTREQLRAALERQKRSGGRLGEWLEREHGIERRVVTRALATQWGCPVLTVEGHSPEKMARLAPRLLVDACGFLPLRRAGSALVYLGFEDRIDRSVSFAMERMTGLHVEAGVVDGGDYAAAHRRMLGAAYPPARMVEAAGIDALAGALTRMIEEARPVEARVVRMHDYLWMRMWKRAERRPAGGAAAAPAAAPPEDGFEDVLGWLAEARP